jgi:hypothetical protein
MFALRAWSFALSLWVSIACIPAFAVTKTCVAEKGSGTIVGRLAFASSAGSAGVKIFESSEASDAYIDTFKQTLEQESLLMTSFGDPKRLQEQIMRQMRATPSSDWSQPAASSDAVSSQAATMRRLKMVTGFSGVLASAPMASLDQQGAFTCGGLKPGSYNLLAEMQRALPASVSMKYGTGVKQMIFYSAKHVVVLKPKVGIGSVVNVTRFTLLGKRPPSP